jgi:predicted enzyme related to lactoylglutathione lyase
MTPTVVKWQIVTPQPQASADFYQKLFGWRVSRLAGAAAVAELRAALH